MTQWALEWLHLVSTGRASHRRGHGRSRLRTSAWMVILPAVSCAEDASIVMIGDQGRFVTQEYRFSRRSWDYNREGGAGVNSNSERNAGLTRE
jgi:hypothetical protein